MYCSPECDRVHWTRHKTPAHVAWLLLVRPMRGFPHRHFVFVGDSSYGTSDSARFCQRHHDHLTLLSKFCGDAALYEPPPLRTRRTMRRRRVNGL
jgi:hypothetical protein